MRNTAIFLVHLVTVCVFSGLVKGQCKDQSNNEIDWYVVYKLPKNTSHSNKLIKEGVGYVYMTSDDYSEWTLSNVSITDSKSLVAYTLEGLYDVNRQDDLYILYNDQPPYGDSSESKGHTKGVVLADKNQGFWLIHSVPHFPFSLDSYQYPETGKHYGQSFLCLSMNQKNLNSVGLQLQYNEPHVFAQNTPRNLESIFPELLKAAQNQTVKSSPWYNVQNLETKAGTSLVSFAKSGKFQKDLYSDLVSFELASDLYVETWPNEPNRLPSECDKKYEVDNVLSISIQEADMSFKSTKDHSKWAVSSKNSPNKWICIGDINRAEKQTLRGGGTTCIKNKLLAMRYEKTVSEVQSCNTLFSN